MWGPVKPRGPSWAPWAPVARPLIWIPEWKESRIALCWLRATQRSSRQSLFSTTDFLHSLFASRCSLFAAFFAVDNSLLAASFLLFTDLYSLLASRWSVLSSSCLIIISLSSPLAVIWMLSITWYLLFVIPKLAAHTCRSLIAVRKPWIVARCSLCVTRF